MEAARATWGGSRLPTWNQVGRGGQVALNVLLLLPLGVAIGCLPRARLTLVIILAAFALPFLIEAIQMAAVPLGRLCQAAT